jgi:hypothetical protein
VATNQWTLAGSHDRVSPLVDHGISDLGSLPDYLGPLAYNLGPLQTHFHPVPNHLGPLAYDNLATVRTHHWRLVADDPIPVEDHPMPHWSTRNHSWMGHHRVSLVDHPTLVAWNWNNEGPMGTHSAMVARHHPRPMGTHPTLVA